MAVIQLSCACKHTAWGKGRVIKVHTISSCTFSSQVEMLKLFRWPLSFMDRRRRPATAFYSAVSSGSLGAPTPVTWSFVYSFYCSSSNSSHFQFHTEKLHYGRSGGSPIRRYTSWWCCLCVFKVFPRCPPVNLNLRTVYNHMEAVITCCDWQYWESSLSTWTSPKFSSQIWKWTSPVHSS